jgi:hypothetical protein
MSADNAEIARRWLELASVRPEEIHAVAAELWDPDADYYPVRKFPESRPCHGVEEVVEFLIRFRDAWSRYDFAINDVIEIADDRVLVCANLRAEGRGSGMKLEGDLYQCIWMRHGRFFRVEDHLTLKGALGAFGLEGATLEAAGLRA